VGLHLDHRFAGDRCHRNPVLIILELRVRAPVVDLRVFKERTYSTGVLLMTVLGFGLYGSLVLFPILLQTMMGYPPLESGIAMAPRGVDRCSPCR